MLVLIQARSNSKRFHKKVLFPVNNKPLIWYVFKRVATTKFAKKILVVTSKNKTDDELVKVLKKYKISYFRGDLNNVAKRMCSAAKKYKKKRFMRINGDSPLIDRKVMQKVYNLYKKNRNSDIITNVFPRTFPKGQSVEIIKTELLNKFEKKFSKKDQEHVTSFFYKNYQAFKIKNLKNNKGNLSNLNLAIDYKKDLKENYNKIYKGI